MSFRPTRSFMYFLCFVGLAFLIILSCTKDSDLLLDSVLKDDVNPAVEKDSSEINSSDDNLDFSEEDIEELESRTTTFPSVQDAYIQNGKGYNQNIIRLQENFRKSYLMFDLSQVDSIGGNITSARLKFIVNGDEGDGIIKVFKGATNTWTENSLSEKIAPEIIAELGKIEQVFEVGAEISINLNTEELFPGLSTLILAHEDGDDLAFASKENMSESGPKLVVTYDAPISSYAIEVDDNQILAETTEEDTIEEDSTEEDSTEEDSTEEDSTEEDSTEEDSIEEDTTEEDTTEEDTTEEDTTEEDTTEEDTTEEESNTPPNAVAEATALTGVVPLAVSFSSSKSSDDKGIATYEWNFKNGTTVSSANPQHTFTKSGSYAVVLKITDAEGLESTDTITITVNEKDNEAPVAKAGANVISGIAPLQVNFNGSDSTDDDEVVKYSWDFKNSSLSNLANPTQIFITPGTYVVELVVEDGKGLTDTDFVTITVNDKDNEVPVAKAGANVISGIAPLEVNFKGDDSTDDDEVVKYSWDFKNGSSSNLVNPTQTFNTPGTYVVELTVEDGKGLTGIDFVTITVDKDNEAPVAIAGANVISGIAPLEVNFKGDDSTDDDEVVNYSWDFKNGSSSNLVNPTQTFNTPGTYVVELVVEDGKGLTDTGFITITVNEKDNEAPVAKAGANVISGIAPLEVNFKGDDSTDDDEVVKYSWDFKNSFSSSLANPTQTFNTPGTYVVELVVEDGKGLTGTDFITITVDKDNEAPVAIAGANVISGIAPLEVNFKGDDSTDDDEVVKYSWDFKNSSSSSLANPTQIFITPGTYVVELVVEDGKGLTGTDFITITVDKDNEAPVAIAGANVISGIAPLEVNFKGDDSTDDDEVVNYSWDFKNGSSSNLVNPTQTFNTPGTYVVELVVEDGKGLTDTGFITITVNEKDNEAPIAIAGANVISGIAPLQVNFNGSDSTDDDEVIKYSWDFKNSSSSSLANPTQIFITPGTYVVELVVEDGKGLTGTDFITITVNEKDNEAPVAKAGANVISGIAPLEVNFTGSNSSDDQGIVSYLWDFFDGSTSDDANPLHTFVTPGKYYVDLSVYDAQGLSGSAVVTINVEEETIPENTFCSTDGGFAYETGLKTWCWGDISIPSGTSNGRDGFSNGQLALNTECNGNMVKAQGDRLKFTVDPTSPSAQSWCSSNYNYRAEIRTMPWNVDHPSGTEQWIGYNYGFDDTYIADPTNNWIFYQSHEGTIGTNPLLSLQIDGRTGSSYKIGEIVVVNASKDTPVNSIYGTNVVPKAGEAFDIVMHIIWGDENTGLFQLWLNGNKIVDKQTRTVRSSTRVGGNSKFGIYKHAWTGNSGIQNSAAQGVSNVETSMGPLRMITRKPGDVDYKKNSYSEVKPN